MKKNLEKNANGKLCFGSRIARNRLLSLNPKPLDYPGPFEYYHNFDWIKKFPNKTGYTLIASKTPRDKDFKKTEDIAPPVGTYDIENPKNWKSSARPFGIGEKLKSHPRFLTPAPGTYNTFKRQVKVCTSFGHDRITVPLVKISCAPFNMAYCSKCEQTPIGDYWHKKATNQDLCRPCMEEEWNDLKKCNTKVVVRYRKKNELNMYTLVRYCNFYHEHNCTKAAVQHMPTKDLIFKLRKENYLSSFGL
ncbi:uncharacterized protein LOC129918730 [Episyrphus balteatus]|uniref:uncharacterized protein LOC129918730 n=1 Tax=Episyrphus balteatus TaxID=286459 RepID=UPI0024867E89|nr:uncharacterized protein LOC129918730 [Episyrphus balteatus]XP_055855405.1 uncharacterized protein LOC129918730 [Episyrphus balteatus]XP_055855406.1 uncharacterized protein LOC129918730 [Episyrphus balteatus]